ncbi:hypothetical protein K438DRAFT_1750323 [Mycena galopus ATCC 62051]|nr:hypothetical protein K438DRAFT_1750323 [Mycena galopus ATCC 62051]
MSGKQEICESRFEFNNGGKNENEKSTYSVIPAACEHKRRDRTSPTDEGGASDWQHKTRGKIRGRSVRVEACIFAVKAAKEKKGETRTPEVAKGERRKGLKETDYASTYPSRSDLERSSVFEWHAMNAETAQPYAFTRQIAPETKGRTKSDGRRTRDKAQYKDTEFKDAVQRNRLGYAVVVVVWDLGLGVAQASRKGYTYSTRTESGIGIGFGQRAESKGRKGGPGAELNLAGCDAGRELAVGQGGDARTEQGRRGARETENRERGETRLLKKQRAQTSSAKGEAYGRLSVRWSERLVVRQETRRAGAILLEVRCEPRTRSQKASHGNRRGKDKGGPDDNGALERRGERCGAACKILTYDGHRNPFAEESAGQAGEGVGGFASEDVVERDEKYKIGNRRHVVGELKKLGYLNSYAEFVCTLTTFLPAAERLGGQYSPPARALFQEAPESMIMPSGREEGNALLDTGSAWVRHSTKVASIVVPNA